MIVGVLEHPGVRILLVVVRDDAEPATQVYSGSGSDRKEPVPLAVWWLLCSWILGDSVTPCIGIDIGIDIVASLVILGIPEHLIFGLPLGIVGVDAELASKVCSEHWFRLEGTQATCRLGVPVSLGVPVTPGVGAIVVASSTVILGLLEHLGVGHPLGIVGMSVEPAPKVCSGHRSSPWLSQGTCVPGSWDCT